MSTEYSKYLERSGRHINREQSPDGYPSVSISHVVGTLRRYGQVIILSLLAVCVSYLIIALAIYLFSSSERITSQTFRLDFEGAGNGEYPNKTKFNVADIINGPILNRVWRDNRLGAYIDFGEFSRSVFVLESNRDWDRLTAEYSIKLADPKLSPVDRDRLQREFELKTQSISKNDYAVYFDQQTNVRAVPDPLARKVLLDILNDWADFAVNQQHVIAYQVSIISPEILEPSALERSDAVAAMAVLRSRVNRVITNIQTIEKLPGATLARTPDDKLSLEEVRIRLDEILRFRLEPLLSAVLHSSNLINDRAASTRFLESQLAFDQRQLEAAQRLADSIRESIAVYEQPGAKEAAATTTEAKASPQPKGNEAVMPQLSDTFLDRLMALTGHAADAKYRQDVVDRYRNAIADTIPLKQAVAYDNQMLEELKKPGGGTVVMSAAVVQDQISQMHTEVGQLITKMNELFLSVSRNMTPSTQLFTLTGPPSARSAHGVKLQTLALYGVLVILVALPLIVVLCLLHNRVREEEASEEYLQERLTDAHTVP
jgi:hypothetical protein